MKISQLHILILAYILTASSSVISVQGSSPRFAVIRLGNLGFDPSTVDGINDAGEVVGTSRDLATNSHAFRWVNGVIEDLNPNISGSSFAFDINNAGQIVGQAGFEGQYVNGRAFLWENGQMMDLGTLGGESSKANGINNLGQIVGWSNFEMTSGRQRAFLWQNGAMSLLGSSCNECLGAAEDINNLGIIVGGACTQDFCQHAVMWDTNGNLTELPIIGFSSVAIGINDLNQIVGLSDERAVLWENGQIIDLDPGNIFGSFAEDINNNGLIVGANFKGRDHGVLWDTNRRQHNLNFEIAPLNKWWIEEGAAINDNNQIAVDIGNRKGGFEFFAAILTPVNPVFELVEPVPGVAGALNTIVARGGNLKAGSVVSFYWGLQGGGTLMPNCNMLDAVLQIENARFAGSAVADGNGVATLEGMVPPGAQGQNILFQAVTGPNSPTGCGQSQLVVVKFQ